jgi:hypothetical protein
MLWYACSALGKLIADSGEEVYKMDRDELRETCGIRDGIRLYGHLQRDRAQAARKAGSTDSLSEFQKKLGQRKTRTDAVMKAVDAFRGAGKKKLSQIEEEPEDDLADMPKWKRELIKKQRRQKEEEESPPAERRSRGGKREKDRRGNRRDDSDEEVDDKRRKKNVKRRGKDDASDSEEEDNKKSRSKRKEKETKRKKEEEMKRKKGEESRKKKSPKKKTQVSDDEEDEKKGKRKGRKEEKRKKDDKKSPKKKPTSDDDFDSSEVTSDESDAATDSSEEESSSSAGEKETKKVTSSEAAQVPGAKWSLGQGDEEEIEKIDEKIRSQQLEIQKELTNLSRLQREIGLKNLPTLQQKLLQGDLSKLQVLQGRLKEAPTNKELQMQLVGQQMLLTEHLLQIQESLSHNLPDIESQLEQAVHSNSRMSHSLSSGNISGRSNIHTAQQHIPIQHMPAPVQQQQVPIVQQPVPVVQQPVPMVQQVPIVQHVPSYDPMMGAMQQQLFANQMRQQIASDMMAEQQRQQMMAAERRRLMAASSFGNPYYSPLTPSVPFM